MSSDRQQASSLRAGAAQVEITPRMGIHVEGHIGIYRPALYVKDPIYAKALVLESGGRKLCVLTLDLLAVTVEWVEEIRRLAAEEFGFAPEAVMVHDSQTHSAPALGHFAFEDSEYIKTAPWWANMGDERYPGYAMPRILEAIRRACASLEPAVIGAAGGIEGRVAFNRRYVMRDGLVRTNPPPGSPQIRYVEGPIDPEVGVVCVSTQELRVLAMLLHYTCHPTHGLPHRYISADWPGAWANEIRSAYGDGIVPLVINGCCGNIRPTNPLDPTWGSDCARMGRMLTETTHPILRTITYGDEAVVDWRSRHLKIPLRELDAGQLEDARKLLADHPDPIWLNEEHTRIHWDWMYAVGTMALHRNIQRSPHFDYEIQVFRVGDIALVAMPGEPFVEGQLAIKLRSPTYPTYVVHHSNAYVGYVPTKQAFDRAGAQSIQHRVADQAGGLAPGHTGSYETRTANWSKLVPEALDMIVENSVQLLCEVFEGTAE